MEWWTDFERRMTPGPCWVCGGMTLFMEVNVVGYQHLECDGYPIDVRENDELVGLIHVKVKQGIESWQRVIWDKEDR